MNTREFFERWAAAWGSSALTARQLLDLTESEISSKVLGSLLSRMSRDGAPVPAGYAVEKVHKPGKPDKYILTSPPGVPCTRCHSPHHLVAGV